MQPTGRSWARSPWVFREATHQSPIARSNFMLIASGLPKLFTKNWFRTITYMQKLSFYNLHTINKLVLSVKTKKNLKVQSSICSAAYYVCLRGHPFYVPVCMSVSTWPSVPRACLCVCVSTWPFVPCAWLCVCVSALHSVARAWLRVCMFMFHGRPFHVACCVSAWPSHMPSIPRGMSHRCKLVRLWLMYWKNCEQSNLWCI